MKRFFGMLLCVVLLCGALGAAADETLRSGNYAYVLIEDGSAVITGWDGTETELSIPGQLDGRIVTGIGQAAFSHCDRLTAVFIPLGITRIGPDAFCDCISLTDLTVPSGVTEIGSAAFSGCASLTTVVIPDSVREIGDRAFRGCSAELVIFAELDSFAARYCQENGLNVQ